MTQFIQPNQKSDLKQDVVRDWISQAYTGVVSGFTVTPGSSNFLVTISSGTCWINGVRIQDDETRIDFNVSIAGGADRHYVIYATHTPAEVFPPPAMVIDSEVATGSPPLPPALPADSVKIADVFVPSTATSINDCRIIQAPRLPARGSNDGDIIVERLVNSNQNLVFGGGGRFTKNTTGANTTINWTEDIILNATTITNKEKFGTVPLASYRLQAGTLGPDPGDFSSPGFDHSTQNTAGTQVVRDNCILFAIVDRTVATDPTSPTDIYLKVIDLDDPDINAANSEDAELFYDPTRENIIFLGAITNGVLQFRSGISSPLPDPVSETNYFLLNDSSGEHTWAQVDDVDTGGGFRVVADETERLAIPLARQKVGMRVHQQDNGLLYKLSSTNASLTNSDFQIDEAGSAPGVVSGCALSNPTGSDIQIDSGIFRNMSGKTINIPSTITKSLGVDGVYYFAWDDSLGDMAFFSLVAAIPDEDMPFAVVERTAGVITYFRDISMAWTGLPWTGWLTVASVAPGGNFATIAQAGQFISAFGGDQGVNKKMRIIGDAQVSDTTSFETSSLTAGGQVTASSGTPRWQREFAVGDWVVISGIQYEVTGIVSDSEITVNNPDGNTAAGVPLERHNTSSRYTGGLDTSIPGLVATYVNGVVISGQGPDLEASEKPTVTWGGGSYVSRRPFFVLQNITVLVDNVAFDYDGQEDLNDNEVCWLKAPGGGSCFKNVDLNGGDISPVETLTCAVNLEPNSTQYGKNVIFDGCRFEGINGVQSKFFNVANSTVGAGVVFANGHLSSPFGSDYVDAVVFYEELARTTFRFDNVVVDGWRTAFALCQTSTAPTTTPISVDNSLLKARVDYAKLGAFRSAGIETGGGGVISDVARQADGSLLITHSALGTDARIVGDVVTVTGMANAGNDGTFLVLKYVSSTQLYIYNPAAVDETGASGTMSWSIGEDVGLLHLENIDLASGAGTHEMHGRGIATGNALRTEFMGRFIPGRGPVVGSDLPMALVSKEVPGAAAWTQNNGLVDNPTLVGLAGRAINKIGSSQIYAGLELTPKAEIIGVASNWYYRASFDVKAGAMVLPNGLQAIVADDTQFRLRTGAALGSDVSRIEDDGATGAGWEAAGAENNIYFFLRKKDGDIAAGITYSTTPPQLNGAFDSATAGGIDTGYTDEDYGYIGMGQFWEVAVNDTAVASDENEAHGSVFRNHTVTYLGNGLRLFSPVDTSFESSGLSDFTATGSFPCVAISSLGADFDKTSGKFKTTSAIQVGLGLTAIVGAGDSFNGTFGVRSVQGPVIMDENNEAAYVSGIMSNNTGGDVHGFVDISSIPGGTISNPQIHTTIAAVIENLNEMQELDHGLANWPYEAP